MRAVVLLLNKPRVCGCMSLFLRKRETTADAAGESSAKELKQQRRMRREIRLAKTGALVSACYLITVLPYYTIAAADPHLQVRRSPLLVRVAVRN